MGDFRRISSQKNPVVKNHPQVPIINKFFKKIGFDKMVFNEVEEPELLDDLRCVI